MSCTISFTKKKKKKKNSESFISFKLMFIGACVINKNFNCQIVQALYKTYLEKLIVFIF